MEDGSSWPHIEARREEVPPWTCSSKRPALASLCICASTHWLRSPLGLRKVNTHRLRHPTSQHAPTHPGSCQISSQFIPKTQPPHFSWPVPPKESQAPGMTTPWLLCAIKTHVKTQLTSQPHFQPPHPHHPFLATTGYSLLPELITKPQCLCPGQPSA